MEKVSNIFLADKSKKSFLTANPDLAIRKEMINLKIIALKNVANAVLFHVGNNIESFS